MPQAADAGDPTGLTQTPPAGKSGQINYLAPQVADVKPTSESKMMSERWQKLAGILKD